jgi:diaminopimelate epimerase
MDLLKKVYKLNGAGNSFFFIFDLPQYSSMAYADWAVPLCMPEGVALTDGLMVITNYGNLDKRFDILFFNPDGSQYSLCFNAMRSAVYLWHHITGNEQVTIHTTKTEFHGSIANKIVTLTFQPWFEEVQPLPIHGLLGRANSWFIPHGDPHVALFDNHFDGRDFLHYAKEIRHNLNVSATGSNFHWLQEKAVNKSEGHFTIRSFERGVEGETNACGSGCLAAAIVLNKERSLQAMAFETKLGDTISVGLNPNGSWYLSGPAVLEYAEDFKG